MQFFHRNYLSIGLALYPVISLGHSSASKPSQAGFTLSAKGGGSCSGKEKIELVQPDLVEIEGFEFAFQKEDQRRSQRRKRCNLALEPNKQGWSFRTVKIIGQVAPVASVRDAAHLDFRIKSFFQGHSHEVQWRQVTETLPFDFSAPFISQWSDCGQPRNLLIDAAIQLKSAPQTIKLVGKVQIALEWRACKRQKSS